MLLKIGEYLHDTTKTILPRDLYPLFPDMERETVNDNLQMLKDEGYVNFTFAGMGPGVRTAFNLTITPLGISYCNTKRMSIVPSVAR
jgi:hypothetical protein